MREVLAHRLWVGNAFDARDLRVLFDHQIQAVVDLAANEKPAQLAREMIYLRIPLVDGEGNGASRIDMAIECAVSLVRRGERTLISCSAGMSRAPAVAAAAIAVIERAQPDDCLLRVVRNAPHDISPALWKEVSESALAVLAREVL